MSAMGSLLSGGDEGRKHAKACLRGGSNRFHFRRPNPGRIGIGGEHALADEVAQRFGECGHVDGEPEPLQRPEGHAQGAQHFALAQQRKDRSEEHTSELQSLMRTSYAVFCLNKKKTTTDTTERERSDNR